MKKIALYSLLLTLALTHEVIAQNSASTKMIVEGFYSGINLVIKNPVCLGSGEYGYAINDNVKVNGDYTTADMIQEMFEIPLDQCRLKIGDPVKIELSYKKTCTPLNLPNLMNPGALLSLENMANKNENNITIEGTYSPNSLLIVNSNKCIKEIKVNGKILDMKLDKDVVEINLRALSASMGVKDGLKDGDKLKITLKCNKNGQPLILNPDCLHYY